MSFEKKTVNLHQHILNTKTKNMKRHYYKPQMLVVKIVGRQQLLNTSGLLMNMPDYSQGGDGTGDNDGWSD